MTDGILLAEIQQDPWLNQYDVLVIDEAHERSLNIDFLLGYLKQLLPRRPDLKVIITSATIDPERFSRHFEDAPIIMVERKPEGKPKSIDDMTDDEVMAGFKACGKRLGILKSRREEIEDLIAMHEQKAGHFRSKVIELEKKGAPEDEIRRCGRVLGTLYLDSKSLPRHLAAVKGAQFDTHKVKDAFAAEAEVRRLFPGSPKSLEQQGRKGKPGGRKRSARTAGMAESEKELREMREAGLISGKEFDKKKKALRRKNRSRKSADQLPGGKPKKDEKKGKKKR